jgi:hypothetical protein
VAQCMLKSELHKKLEAFHIEFKKKTVKNLWKT